MYLELLPPEAVYSAPAPEPGSGGVERDVGPERVDHLLAVQPRLSVVAGELSGALDVAFSIDGDGFPHDVVVKGASAHSDDAALNRCHFRTCHHCCRRPAMAAAA